MRIVASNPDAMGDFVLRQPFYAALHEAGHEILLIVRPHALPLIPFIAPFATAVVLPADPYKTDIAANWDVFAPLLQTIEEFKPDLIVTTVFNWTAFDEKLATHFSDVPIAGMTGQHTGIAPSNGLQKPGGRNFDPVAEVLEDQPESEKNQALARAILGTEVVLPDSTILLTPEAEKLARTELNRQGISPGNYWIVCVGGALNVSVKTWPSNRWSDVLSVWMKSNESHLLFTGLSMEEPAIHATREGMTAAEGQIHQWLDDKGSQIETLIGLIALSKGYIGHDTGPMHLAAALKRPVFALFGGGHWGRFLPASPSTCVLTVGVPCIGCEWNCPFHCAYCIHDIPVDEVSKALHEWSKSTGPRRDIRILQKSPELIAEMLAESARLSASEKREIDATTSALTQRNAEITVLRTMMGTTAASAEANRQAAQERLDVMMALDVEVKRQRDLMHQYEAEIAVVNAVAEDAKKRIAEREAEVTLVKNNADALRKKIAEKDAEIALAKVTAEAFKKKMAKSDDEFSLAKTVAEEIKKRLKQNEAEASLAKAALEEAQKRTAQAEAEAALAKASGEAAQRQIAEQDAEIALAKAAAEEAERRLAESSAEAALAKAAAEEARNRVAAKDAELASARLADESAQKRIAEQNFAFAQLMNDRNAWVAIYRTAEAKLKKNDDLFWHERIADSTRRIAKHALYGRQYIRKPEVPPLPTMTIVTPVFNCVEYIRDTIESILNQNYPHLDYIVVDGGSTDGTLQVLEEYKGRINRIIHGPDNGMYDAIGKGFDASGGEIMAYLNADDMFEPGALLRVGAYFREHPKADVIYHENTVAANGWRFANTAQPHVDMFDLLKGHILFQDGVFFRRKAYTAIGGINRTLRRAGDYALWLEMSLWFKFHRVPGHVSAFRVREGQISANMDAYEKEQEIARQSFKQHLSSKRKWRRVPGHVLNGIRNVKERFFSSREFFYPADFPNMPPPPGREPDLRLPAPICPLSSEMPTRLLLSARHPRLTGIEIQRTYFCEKTRIAINHPRPSAEQFDGLRAYRFEVPPVDWSKPPAGTVLPQAPYASPYAKSSMDGSRLEKVMRTAAIKFLRPNIEFSTPAVAIQANALRDLAGLFNPNDSCVRFLDVACFDGGMLDTIRGGTKWQCSGLETNATLAAVTRSKGHRISDYSIDDAPFAFPVSERFHIVYLGSTLPYLANPVKTLNALQSLLAPGGVLMIGSPNLDSKQLEWFGPSWAHWHITRFHALYSRKAFERLAELSNMKIIRARSFSHAEWTAFGMHFQAHGLAWSVPHVSTIPQSAIQHAARLERLVKFACDFRGKGDYLSAILKSK